MYARPKPNPLYRNFFSSSLFFFKCFFLFFFHHFGIRHRMSYPLVINTTCRIREIAFFHYGNFLWWTPCCNQRRRGCRGWRGWQSKEDDLIFAESQSQPRLPVSQLFCPRITPLIMKALLIFSTKPSARRQSLAPHRGPQRTLSMTNIQVNLTCTNNINEILSMTLLHVLVRSRLTSRGERHTYNTERAR